MSTLGKKKPDTQRAGDEESEDVENQVNAMNLENAMNTQSNW